MKKIKKEKSKARKIIDWIFTGLLAFTFLFVAVINVQAQVSKRSNYNVPNYFGYQSLVVLTDSMSPEYKVGTAVIVKKVPPSTIKEGDDVTFFYPRWNAIVTHRVLERHLDENNVYIYTVHGINTDSDNCSTQISDGSGTNKRDCTWQTQTFSEKELLGKVIGQSRAIGFFNKLISSWWGILILLLIPSFYLIVTSVLDIFKAYASDDNHASNGEVIDVKANEKNPSLDSLSEDDKERLKKELLNEMLDKGDKK